MLEVGKEYGPSSWIEVGQDRIDAFAEATGDRQWIHVDPERAAAGPFGTTIGHGYLTLSLLPVMSYEVVPRQDGGMAVNYGLNKVRFPAPVPSGSRVHGTFKVESVDEADDAVLRGDVAGLERRGHEPVHGCDREEAAVARRRQRIPGVLREQERARHENGHERVPAFLGKVAHRRDVLEAGVGDNRVETAVESLERGIDDRAVSRGRRQVAVRDVDRVHAPAVGGQPVADRCADPAGRPGDEDAAAHA